jgi:hypothetical protein
VPCLPHFPVSHPAHGNAAGGSGESAPLSSPNGSGPGVPSPWWRLPPPRSRQSRSSLSSDEATSWRDGTGTEGSLPWQPALSSTLPLSLPEWGLARAWPGPQCAAKRRKGPETLTVSPTRRPTSVASSRTALRGTPPMSSRTLRGPWQTHSASSPQKAWASPTLECGRVMARHLPPVVAPRATSSRRRLT